MVKNSETILTLLKMRLNMLKNTYTTLRKFQLVNWSQKISAGTILVVMTSLVLLWIKAHVAHVTKLLQLACLNRE